MNSRGIVFTADSLFALAGVMLIFSAVFVLIQAGGTENAQMSAKYSRAADVATVNFYGGDNVIEIPDPTAQNSVCKEVLGFDIAASPVKLIGRECT